MDSPRRSVRTAIVLAFGVAVASTVLATRQTDLVQAVRNAMHVLVAVASWVVFVAAALAWDPDRRWAPWAMGAAAGTAALLAATVHETGQVLMVLGHAGLSILLAHGLWAHVHRAGWSLRADLRANPLRWANAAVALLAAVAAHVSGVLYATLEPDTAWGPWAYVGLAWATSALAACAWMRPPWRSLGLVAGGLASAAWFLRMWPFQFTPNLAGHALAAVFFLATAWDERPTRSTWSGSSAPPT